MALAWCRRGFKVGVSDINMDGADETLELVRRAGGSGECLKCDVQDPAQVAALADHFFDLWGEVGILVNNAGVADVGIIGDIPLDKWRRTVDTSIWGTVYGCHAFLPRMKARGAGHIVNTASAAGFINLPEMGPYNMVKAGIISLSETLRIELAPFDIGVTVLCPSFISTNLRRNVTCTDQWQDDFVRALFDNARVTPEQVAECAVRAVERNRLYVVPQSTPRWGWRLKRINPGAFCSAFAAGYKRPQGKSVAMFFARKGVI